MSHYGETLQWLCEKHGIRMAGVLHIGANTGQEAAEYDDLGCKVIWIEGDPEVYGRLCAAIAGYPKQQAHCCLCSDADGEQVEFHVASNEGGSSSVLPPNDGVFGQFGVQMVATRELTTSRLDTYFAQRGVSLDGVNLINIDVQGFELPALRGLGELLGRFDAVMAELNWAAAYKGATRPHALESYLAAHGFRRAFLSVAYPQGGGMWVKTAMKPWTRAYMAASMRLIEALSALGFFRLLQGSRLRALLRRIYYRFKGRRV